MKKLNYGHSKGKNEKAKKETNLEKSIMIRYLNLFYFSTYEPRTMQKEKPRIYYIHVLLSHAQPHLIFTAVCKGKVNTICPTS